MERVKHILDASVVWRALVAVSLWFGRQWQSSGVVQWFLNPSKLDEAAAQNSLIFRIWSLIWGCVTRLYRMLRLERLFSGSVFLCAGFWCGLPLVLAPLLPTMAVLGLVMVGYCSMFLSMLHRGERQLAYSPINKYLLLYGGVYLMATFMSVDVPGSLQPALLAIFFSMFPLALENSLTTRRALECVSSAMVLSGVVVSLVGIGQYVFGAAGAESWVDSDMFSDITVRVYSTLQNPNVLAEYLLLVIPISVALLLNAKGWIERSFYLGCCGILCLCMVLTFSRGGWLGLIIAAGVFVLLLEPRLLALAPFAFVVLYFVMPDTVVSRLTSVGDLRDSSTSYRVAIWMGSLAMLKDYWLCGVGPGTEAFNLIYSVYSYNAANAQHAHNLYLQLMADGGICLLGLFLIIVVVLFRRICACLTAHRDSGCRFFLIAIIAGMTGFLAQSMTDHSFYNYRVTLMFWAVAGLGAAWVRCCEKEANT